MELFVYMKTIFIITVLLFSFSLGQKSRTIYGDYAEKEYQERIYEFVDSRDNQKYRLVKIGNKFFFLNNLNYASKKSFCYDNNPTNCTNSGRLYVWEEAREVCPVGFELMDKESLEKVLKNTFASSLFKQELAGFRNSKGDYELKDKRLDLWLSDSIDGNKLRYWFYSASNSKADFSTYSRSGAMSVRCVGKFLNPNDGSINACIEGCVRHIGSDECVYEYDGGLCCAWDRAEQFLLEKSFENENILVCVYFEKSIHGYDCPHSYSYSAKFWKKNRTDIAECPSPNDDFDEVSWGALVEKSELFVGKSGDAVVTNKGLCDLPISDVEKFEPKYRNCVPMSKASKKLAPLGRKLLGVLK